MTAKTTIVSVAELAAHPEWRVFDCSHEISDPEAGAQAYAREHIPGAVHARMETVLSGARSGANGRNPLCDPQTLAAWLGKAGVENRDQIVVYDRSNGAAAARMWWSLRWLGHPAVALLDGGLATWKLARHAVVEEIPAFSQTTFAIQPDDTAHVDLDFIGSVLDKGTHLLIDARPDPKFHGIGETTDPRGGHIPGASNRPSSDNLGADGLFKSPTELRREWLDMIGAAEPGQVVAYCGSGVSACHNLLALEIAGLPGAKLYPGSWSEWCAVPERPIETE